MAEENLATTPSKGYARAQAISFGLIYISYMVFYFCRKNYAFWLNELVRTVGRPKEEVSIFGSVMEFSYGAGKLIAGPIVDSAPPAAVLSSTLAITALCNIFMFQSPWTWLDLGLWSINGIVQSAAWPALAAIFMNWFRNSPNRATWYSILSTNQNLGSALCPIILTPVVQLYGWRAATWAPGLIGLTLAAIFAIFLTDGPKEDVQHQTPRPKDVRVNDTQTKMGDDSSKQEPASQTSWSDTLIEMCTSVHLLSLGIGYAFLQALRVGVQDWSLIILQETRGVSLEAARDCMVTLEIGGFLGGISAGALSDRLFNGRRGPVIVFFTALLAPLIMAMANFPLPKGFEDVTLAGIYFCFGLFSFGPHVLVGLTAREVFPKAPSTAGSFAKSVAQVGGTAAGYPLSLVVNSYGWDYVTTVWTFCAIFGALAFAPLLAVPSSTQISKAKTA